MKRVLTLREKAAFSNGFLGIIWIIMGIVGIMDIFKRNTILNLVVAIFLVVASILVFVPHFIKTEPEDEMSEYNNNKAKSRIYELLSLGILICTLISILKGIWVIDLKIILPFVLGGVNLLEFILFVVYEKVGV
ncbi:MAG TPA: hypothetical protein DCM59_08690 [Clostridium sp.]|nr:hypothetical protein [Clostridium sp.]